MSPLWVGLDDHGEEGAWRFPSNSEYFDPNWGGTLFKWEPGEPNDYHGEDCAQARDNLRLFDDNCDEEFYGLCEIKVFDC